MERTFFEMGDSGEIYFSTLKNPKKMGSSIDDNHRVFDLFKDAINEQFIEDRWSHETQWGGLWKNGTELYAVASCDEVTMPNGSMMAMRLISDTEIEQMLHCVITIENGELFECGPGEYNAYLAGIPTFRIMLITGHRSESSFFKYVRIEKEENAEILLNHKFFQI